MWTKVYRPDLTDKELAARAAASRGFRAIHPLPPRVPSPPLNEPAVPIPPQPPRSVRTVVVVACGLILLTSLPLAVIAGLLPQIRSDEKPALALMGFEIVVAVAAVLGVLWGRPSRGAPDLGPALGLACIAGTILAASALGWQGANRNLAGHSLTPLLIFRAAFALGMLAMAGLLVLGRDRRSWPMALRGLALLAPVVLIAGAILYPTTRAMIERLMGNTIIAFTLTTLGFLGASVLIALGGHCLIRAFEFGRADGPR